MATFSYRTLGGGSAATIEAPDRAAAVRELMRRGETPTSVEPLGSNGLAKAVARAASSSPHPAPIAAGPRISLASRIMSRAETATFIRELATALSAGLPLVQALRTMTKQGRTSRQKVMLDAVIGEVEHGKSLADAMAPWQRTFGELTVNLVRAGEVSGQLSEVLAQAAELLDKDLKLRRSILGAILYPLIICGLVVIAVIVVVTFIVPNILKQLAGQATRLPWPTQVVKAAGEFFGSLWWGIVPGWAVMLTACGVAVFMFRQYYERPEGRLRVDTTLLRTPLLGRLLRDVAVARFTRTLGTLTAAGIPIISALRVTRGTLGNRRRSRRAGPGRQDHRRAHGEERLLPPDARADREPR